MKNNVKITICAVIVALLILIFIYSFKSSSENDSIIISYELVEDLPVGASEQDLAKFAWQEFFALNWQSSFEKDNNRTTPDKTWDFKNSGSQPNLAVWETFVHRSELNPTSNKLVNDLSKGKPAYTFLNFKPTTDSEISLSNYWNILDEDNEIGSANLFAHLNQNEVLYMAKTNLVEYNYMKNNFPNYSQQLAATNKVNLLTTEQQLTHFKSLTKAGMCASDSLTQKGYICLPCGDEKGAKGVTELKMAFIKLDPKKDDTTRFITKNVVVFFKDKNDVIRPKTDVYGLIGMHIIHKSKNYPSFILASFEQSDVRNASMQTFGLDAPLVDGKMQPGVDPHRLNPVIERVIPENVQTVNDLVKKAIIKVNPNSKWQYYQLVGVQANPKDYKNRNSDNNYFMANYVIESDLLLTNFHGSFDDPFNSAIQNVVSDGKSYNMGGCMGCHGQAQVKFGTDFSFIVAKKGFSADILQSYKQVTNDAKIADKKAFDMYVETVLKKR